MEFHGQKEFDPMKAYNSQGLQQKKPKQNNRTEQYVHTGHVVSSKWLKDMAVQFDLKQQC